MGIDRIVFMGTPEFAVPSLQILLDRRETVTGVVTQPDRPAGRGQKLTPSPVKKLAVKSSLPVFQPDDVKEIQFMHTLKTLAPDLVVVVAYGRIFPRHLLEIPRFGFLNVHSSLLPAYRGPAPINAAIINGETETGVSIIILDEGMDTGDIIIREATPILPEDNALTLHDRLSVLGAKLLGKALDMHRAGLWNPVPQNHEKATYAPLLKKSDGLICWDNDARSILNQIRGMTPWPGCFSYLNGKLIKIHCAETVEKETNLPPGRVVSVSDKGINISTGRGILLIREIQLEGKKKMTADHFVKGFTLTPGAEFSTTR